MVPRQFSGHDSGCVCVCVCVCEFATLASLSLVISVHHTVKHIVFCWTLLFIAIQACMICLPLINGSKGGNSQTITSQPISIISPLKSSAITNTIA